MKHRAYVVYAAAVACAVGFVVGRCTAPRRTETAAPEPSRAKEAAPRPVEETGAREPAARPPEAPEAREEEPRPPALPADEDNAPEPPPAFAIPADRPLRISWPLDIGPGLPGRACLRARQGANELQNLDDGKALYAFRVTRAGLYRSFLKVKWLDDGVGDIDCNDTWFVAFDDRPTRSVGRDHAGPVWHWVRGPALFLRPGVHWYVVEMREDGTLLDRIALVPQDVPATPEALEGLPLVSFSDLSGERPATCPSSPVRDVELEALPTGSLVIGSGHSNELTVLASFQGKSGGFTGEIRVESVTSSMLRLGGETTIRCSADAPYARAVVDLEFGPRARRRAHKVVLRVVDTTRPGKKDCVLRKEFTFFKPAAWAFLGPFPDPTCGRAGAADPPDVSRLDALGMRAPWEQVFAKEPVAPVGPEDDKAAPAEWKLVADGSCYDELGAVDLFKVYGATTNAYCYAVTWFHIPRSSNHRTFSFQSDDTASVWIDRQLLALMPVVLPREHNRLWCAVPLRAGLNPVVVKIAQGEHYWGFRFEALNWHWQGRIGDVIRWAEPEDWPCPE